jgi:hypothetical protein
MKPIKLSWLALLTLPLLLLSGCATSALWDEGRFARFHEPADEPNLRLFQSAQGDDVLVQYTEIRDTDEKQWQRAYWLHQNEKRVKERRKPHFIQTHKALALNPIPVIVPPATPIPCLNPDVYALASTNSGDFVLYLAGEKLGDYQLPVYRDASGRVKQVLLTPVVFAADLTIVGGFIAYALLPGAWSGLNGVSR